jgi:hypothetical protein
MSSKQDLESYDIPELTYEKQSESMIVKAIGNFLRGV